MQQKIFKENCSTFANEFGGAINSGVPITDFANERFFNVARPRSPIFTDPVVPVINMLSHFKSRCIIGGVLVIN
ncbi:hypothetical protein DERP_011632 [Dermatophagoides pteronyssinus]|uniref:Uncharacterized protein n=1 Tax=Dermatophagoides pteronyssinus TaxID=6956 RepID=A0ABQ8JX05_DERPT|nr:hypothetical protein DERP_011632 [Dermatophagoides pteronyssinus]